MSGNFVIRYELFLNGQRLSVGRDDDVYLEDGRWNFRHQEEHPQNDVIVNLYVCGVLVSQKRVAPAACFWASAAL